MAAPEEIPPPERVWPDEDWYLSRRGHKSTDMDDKWHAYVERQRLYLHRSWTGLGIYEAEFGQVPDARCQVPGARRLADNLGRRNG